jgi:hypothetical protein
MTKIRPVLDVLRVYVRYARELPQLFEKKNPPHTRVCEKPHAHIRVALIAPTVVFRHYDTRRGEKL